MPGATTRTVVARAIVRHSSISETPVPTYGGTLAYVPGARPQGRIPTPLIDGKQAASGSSMGRPYSPHEQLQDVAARTSTFT
jgi:hypothetical protein